MLSHLIRTQSAADATEKSDAKPHEGRAVCRGAVPRGGVEEFEDVGYGTGKTKCGAKDGLPVGEEDMS